MDLLTTYTHHSELQVDIALLLISTLQITTVPAKSFPACYVFISRPMATASNSRDSSALRTQVLFLQPPVQNSVPN
jgi:hypothetical protein